MYPICYSGRLNYLASGLFTGGPLDCVVLGSPTTHNIL